MDQVLTTDLIRPLCGVSTIIISLLTDGEWRVTESQGKGFKPKQSDPDQCPQLLFHAMPLSKFMLKKSECSTQWIILPHINSDAFTCSEALTKCPLRQKSVPEL